jgi:hypothetical protein
MDDSGPQDDAWRRSIRSIGLGLLCEAFDETKKQSATSAPRSRHGESDAPIRDRLRIAFISCQSLQTFLQRLVALAASLRLLFLRQRLSRYT